jgi:hypothetical protein
MRREHVFGRGSGNEFDVALGLRLAHALLSRRFAALAFLFAAAAFLAPFLVFAFLLVLAFAARRPTNSNPSATHEHSARLPPTPNPCSPPYPAALSLPSALVVVGASAFLSSPPFSGLSSPSSSLPAAAEVPASSPLSSSSSMRRDLR